MNLMTHKGYAARIEYSYEDDCFLGHIAGIQDVVSFHGASVVELHAALASAKSKSLNAWKQEVLPQAVTAT